MEYYSIFLPFGQHARKIYINMFYMQDNYIDKQFSYLLKERFINMSLLTDCTPVSDLIHSNIQHSFNSILIV